LYRCVTARPGSGSSQFDSTMDVKHADVLAPGTRQGLVVQQLITAIESCSSASLSAHDVGPYRTVPHMTLTGWHAARALCYTHTHTHTHPRQYACTQVLPVSTHTHTHTHIHTHKLSYIHTQKSLWESVCRQSNRHGGWGDGAAGCHRGRFLICCPVPEGQAL
jgi:hypothetical protein